MMTSQDSICIEKRFDLLREIITLYQTRLRHMDALVVQLFASDQLTAICANMEEKQRIERLVIKLEQFVIEWEALADMSIDH